MTVNTDEIANRIWKMANTLRGNLDASDYQAYILGFMFYRYLSEKQEEVLKGLKPAENLNDYYNGLDSSNVSSFKNFMLGTHGYAINPEDTWRTIINKANDGTITAEDFQMMFDHFNENVSSKNIKKDKNVGDFSKIFSDIHLSDPKLGDVNSKTTALAKMAQEIDDFQLYDESGHDIIGDIYEELIARFSSHAGKNAGEFYTPHMISKLLSKLTVIDFDDSQSKYDVFDYAMGSGALLLTYLDSIKNGKEKGKIHFYGQELNTTTFNLARMNLMMHDVNYQNMTLRNADTLSKDWPSENSSPLKMDAIAVNPPYSTEWDNSKTRIEDPRFNHYGLAPKGKADLAFLLHGLYHLKDNGTMGIVLPNGVLFRGNTEATIRRQLVDDNKIDAVILLPEKLFHHTGIQTLILVLKNNKKDSNTLFIDASNEFEKCTKQNKLTEENITKIIETYKSRKDVDKYAHLATYDEIKSNDFNLNLPRYVDTFEPEPDIDVNEVKQNIKNIDSKISEIQKEFNEMDEDLSETGVNNNGEN